MGGPTRAAVSSHWHAALLMLGSTVLFGLMAITIRLASASLHTFEIAFFRNFFGLLAALPLLFLLPLLWLLPPLPGLQLPRSSTSRVLRPVTTTVLPFRLWPSATTLLTFTSVPGSPWHSTTTLPAWLPTTLMELTPPPLFCTTVTPSPVCTALLARASASATCARARATDASACACAAAIRA